MTIFSGQSVISRVYTSRFGNGTGSHGTSTEVVLKKYQVPGTVPSGKPPKSEPYRTVPYHAVEKRQYFSAEVHTAKSSYIHNKIKSAPNMRNLFRTFHNLLCPPSPPPTTYITADDFATFFHRQN